MRSAEHLTKYRKDYQPSSYLVESIELTFQLNPEKTRVIATSNLYRNENCKGDFDILRLDGEELELIDISMDDVSLPPGSYKVDENSLTIFSPPEKFVLCITTEINPQTNKSLSGLYRSSNNFCTQCEAEGFRRITYYLDRPDVLARFTARIEADKSDCPVLLSNGNLIAEGSIENNKHFAIWQDPFPKPCYLFALVAGNLVALNDTFTTKSGREISLRIYVEPRNRDKCEHAMVSLKKAMKWDEDIYGLEYDLDIYMIVAVDDFNMGAMENKGLNIFNSKYVLASPESATDLDYLGIEGVIAHEYFHNWTGNRVTCRDWFQLSLKEGLTVFRDQEFSADMNSRAVQRIEDVRILRSAQFREDAGPMAHPVRPDSYVEINNFYTVTVYNKGAEVVRMLYRIVGDDSFHKGMALYFARFDGQAVTCDDFVDAMADASGKDLEQFKLWYAQAGTPVLNVLEKWDEGSKKYILKIEQNCPSTPGQKNKLPFHIPIEIGLINERTRETEFQSPAFEKNSYSLELCEKRGVYEFTGFNEKPILSFLRDFSAPVKVNPFHSRGELSYLMANDENLYNRWEAAFQLSVEVILDVFATKKQGGPPFLDSSYIDAFAVCLKNETDLALSAEAITLPSETYLLQQLDEIEPALLYESVLFVKKTLATELHDDFMRTYHNCNNDNPRSLSYESMARRSLKNRCLLFLMTPGAERKESVEMCLNQLHQNANMTDVMAALSALSHYSSVESNTGFNDFYERWKNYPLVVDKWLMLQATSSQESTLSRVKKLIEHESFSMENPNKVRSLIGAFCSLNHYRFHAESGEGYRFLTEHVLEIDRINPHLAARLLTPLVSYRKYCQKLKVMMEEQLRFLLMQQNLSADVYEIVQKTLDHE
jgi:aminopeptidase N